MTSKICRCIHLWLMLLLFCKPVTQEPASDSEGLSSEKINLGYTEQETRPPLVSIHHTETVVAQIFDADSLVTTPAIAPATPWDDLQVLATVAEDNLSTEQVETSLKALYDSDNNAEAVLSLHPVEHVNEMQDFTPETVFEDNENEAEGKVEYFDDMQVKDENVGPKIVENMMPKTDQLKLPKAEVTSPNSNKPEKPLQQNNELTNTNDSHTTADFDSLTGTQDSGEGSHEENDGTQEDMPSFNEWSQKFLAQEEEKKVAQTQEKGSVDAGNQQKKKNIDRKQNNYASVDCGANIPEANAEAQNAHSILLENKDVYMLNPCSANIWFIVELCDHAHVTSLQLANFEMFSSTVDKFQVSFSTRYPTREWSPVQKFEAKPEKSTQTFAIDPIFAKYIKVEQLSHHGTEHYCPWSLIRVYGNSMVEEYEEHESSSQDDDTSVDEDINTSSNVTDDKQIPQGILKSATDAVLNFVKETAKKLVNTEEDANSTSNTSNAIKYLDNNIQPLPQKTIVQLMPREDFEASCHGNDDMPSMCYLKNGCGSTQNLFFSYQTFLEIVHKICNRNLTSTEVCLTNVSNTLDSTAPNKEESVSDTTWEENVASNSNETREKVVEQANIVFEDAYSTESQRVSDSTVSHRTAEQSIQNLGDRENSKHSLSFETSKRSLSVRIDTESSPDIPIIPTVLHSSTASSHIHVSSITSTISGSIDKFDYGSAPSPLVQPPLAVKEEPDLVEPPTFQPAINLKEIVSETDSESETLPNENLDFNKAAEDLSSIIPSSSSALDRPKVTSPGIVSKNTDQILKDSSTRPREGNLEEVKLDAVVHQSSPEDNIENVQGLKASVWGTKKHEESPNPHVDVLKTTLTDAETREGKAEPEQNSEDLSETDTQLNETFLKSIEFGQHEADSSDLKKNFKHVEALEKKSKNATTDVRSYVEENDDVHTGNQDINIVPMKENPSNTELIDDDGSLKDMHTKTAESSEKHCEVGDAANSKESVETTTSGTDTGPVMNFEAVPTNGPGNGAPNTYGKKESIFVTLSRKIKALEQNVTMTNLFLEELSQRYRKSMDEMQKKTEKKFSMLSRNSKLLTKLNLSQNSTILALTTKVEQLEAQLNDAVSRLKVVNQEVVERHVIGMCLQFLFFVVTWFLLRRGKTEHPERQTYVGDGHLKNSGVTCNANTYYLQHATTEGHEEKFIETKSSTPEAVSDTKRKRRRKNRPVSVAFDRLLHQKPEHRQNIVSRTAGLLFHSPGSHDNIRASVSYSKSLKSCSAESLNVDTHCESNFNTKKSVSSPKSKKVVFHNKKETDGGKPRPWASETPITQERHRYPHTRLVRSKSSGECYENKLALSGIALSTVDPKRSLANAKCSLHSTTTDPFEPLESEKSRWIWGHA